MTELQDTQEFSDGEVSELEQFIRRYDEDTRPLNVRFSVAGKAQARTDEPELTNDDFGSLVKFTLLKALRETLDQFTSSLDLNVEVYVSNPSPEEAA